MENQDSQVNVCGASLEDHVKDLIIAMVQSGSGGGCLTTYQALVEISDKLKRTHGYPDYTPIGVFDQMTLAEQTKGLRGN